MKQNRISMIAIGLVAVLVVVVAGVSAQESTPEPTPEVTITADTPFLGVAFDNTAEQIVIQVMRRSPAAQAGLQDGDIITAINGEAVTPATIAEVIATFAPNDVITVTVDRAGESMDVEVTLGARSTAMVEIRGGQMMPPMGELFEMMPFGQGGGMGGMMMSNQGRLGLTFLNLDATLAEEKSLSVTEGALVTSVDPESPAEVAGLLADDVITAVNGESVDAERTLADRMIAYEAGDVVTFTVLRGEETLEIEATLGQHEQRLFGDMRGMMPNIQIMPPMHGQGQMPHGNMMPPVPATTPETPPAEATPNA
ncbi:MAG: PDZ domain-containing protein [bacterium]|nr:PDZ domain-containing protein [bacterium]